MKHATLVIVMERTQRATTLPELQAAVRDLTLAVIQLAGEARLLESSNPRERSRQALLKFTERRR